MKIGCAMPYVRGMITIETNIAAPVYQVWAMWRPMPNNYGG